MDGYTLTATIIGHIIWPVTLATLVLFLYTKASSIAEFIGEVQYKDIKLTLRKRFDEVGELAEKAVEQEVIKDDSVAAQHLVIHGPISSHLKDRAEKTLSQIFMYEFDKLELTLLKFLDLSAKEIQKTQDPTFIMIDLLNQNLIMKQDFNLYVELRNIRSMIAHARDIKLSDDNFSSYIVYLRLLVHKLNQLLEKKKTESKEMKNSSRHDSPRA
jgi:hypothetical protein